MNNHCHLVITPNFLDQQSKIAYFFAIQKIFSIKSKGVVPYKTLRHVHITRLCKKKKRK